MRMFDQQPLQVLLFVVEQQLQPRALMVEEYMHKNTIRKEEISGINVHELGHDGSILMAMGVF